MSSPAGAGAHSRWRFCHSGSLPSTHRQTRSISKGIFLSFTLQNYTLYPIIANLEEKEKIIKFAIRDSRFANLIVDNMRPQDILILLKKIAIGGKRLTNKQLADEVGISASEVSEALERCRVSKLIDESKQKVNTLALKEFLIHGIKYVFPVSPQAMVRGMATAISAPPLDKMIMSNLVNYVWPDPNGNLRGEAVLPLYRSVPEASRRDPNLYKLLSLVDALRIGRSREVELAINELSKIFSDYDKREY